MKIGILTGPTATGKSSLALEFAHEHGGIEIINADSMLVYRGMDIGTAKPTAEERARVPHHLIDIRDPNQPFTAGEFVRETQAAIQAIEARGNRALIVGGTGFYLKALLYGLWEGAPADLELRRALEAEPTEQLYHRVEKIDPTSALRIGRSDRYRLVRALELHQITGKTPTELQQATSKEADPRFVLWVIDRDNTELHARIAERTRLMVDQGLISEVQKLRDAFPGARALSAVGYAEVCAHLEGKAPEGRKIRPGIPGLQDEIELATRQLVKRQRTWFRGEKASQWFLLEADRQSLLQQMKALYS